MRRGKVWGTAVIVAMTATGMTHVGSANGQIVDNTVDNGKALADQCTVHEPSSCAIAQAFSAESVAVSATSNREVAVSVTDRKWYSSHNSVTIFSNVAGGGTGVIVSAPQGVKAIGDLDPFLHSDEPSPGCVQASISTVNCPYGGFLEGTWYNLTEVTVAANNGNDTINVKPTIPGTGGLDSEVDGGSGDDTIDVRNGSQAQYSLDRVSCGTGFDTVYADPADIVANDCEAVHYLHYY